MTRQRFQQRKDLIGQNFPVCWHEYVRTPVTMECVSEGTLDVGTSHDCRSGDNEDLGNGNCTPFMEQKMGDDQSRPSRSRFLDWCCAVPG